MEIDSSNCNSDSLAKSASDLQVASCPATSHDVLEQLSTNDCHRVVARVAEHPNASPSLLISLARHEHFEVRIGVSDNARTPLDVIFGLAMDEHPDVRYAIAENARMPWAVLQQLAQDENPFVAFRATKTISRISVDRARSAPTRLPTRPSRQSASRAEQTG